MLVEAIRLLVTLTLTALGFSVGRAWGSWFPQAGVDPDVAVTAGAVLGAGLGYVAGGTIGRLIRRGLEGAPKALDRATGPELFAGAFGLITGVVVGTVTALPAVVLLPEALGWPIGALVVLVFGAFGFKVFSSRSTELLSVAGLKVDEPFSAAPAGDVPVERFIVDSSAAIDGRIVELVRSGLLRGSIWVPAFVLGELQAIADAAEPGRRRRGRRGLEVLDAIREHVGDAFEVLSSDVPEHADVDAKLITLVERHDAVLVTTDHNLARNAGIRGLRVINPHALGESLRVAYTAGDHMAVKIERLGTETGQGVAYLEDGTMVVVAGGDELVGAQVDVEVVNVLRTSVGRMVFARLTSEARAFG
jgi:uncharacterized protein YacL